MAFAGSLDPTFGVGGIAVSQLYPGNDAGLSSVFAIAAEPDGSVVELGTAGMADVNAQASSQPTTFGLIRLNANGTLDTSFGTGGEADLALPAGQVGGFGGTLLIQPDGKIVVEGSTSIPMSNTDPTEYSIVARFDADGTPDATFGTGGLVEIGAISTPGVPLFNYAALQSNGQILLAGTAPVPGSTTNAIGLAVTRLTPAGQVDTTFGTGGTVILPAANYARGLKVAPDDQILVLGEQLTTSLTLEIFRLSADGTLDPSFTSTGLQSSPINDPTALAVQPNGQVIVIGAHLTTSIGPQNIYAIVARLNVDGSLDKTVTLPSPVTYSDGANAVGLEPNGDIVTSSTSYLAGPVVARLTPNLTLDATFGTAGIWSIKVPLPVQDSSQNLDVFSGATRWRSRRAARSSWAGPARSGPSTPPPRTTSWPG